MKLREIINEDHSGLTPEDVLRMIKNRITGDPESYVDIISAGPERVLAAAQEVADDIATYWGDNEIGSSDISGFVNDVRRHLGSRLSEGMERPARYKVTMKDGTIRYIDWMYDEGLGQYFIDTYGEEPANIERVKNLSGATPGGLTRDPEATAREKSDAERAAMIRAQSSYERR